MENLSREKTFSRIDYQVELSERLSAASDSEGTDTGWVVFEVGSGLRRIEGSRVEMVARVDGHTAVPAAVPWVFGLANVKARALLLSDPEAWERSEPSRFQHAPLPAGHLCLVVKDRAVGLVCRVRAGARREEAEGCADFPLDEFLLETTRGARGAAEGQQGGVE